MAKSYITPNCLLSLKHKLSKTVKNSFHDYLKQVQKFTY